MNDDSEKSHFVWRWLAVCAECWRVVLSRVLAVKIQLKSSIHKINLRAEHINIPPGHTRLKLTKMMTIVWYSTPCHTNSVEKTENLALIMMNCSVNIVKPPGAKTNTNFHYSATTDDVPVSWTWNSSLIFQHSFSTTANSRPSTHLIQFFFYVCSTLIACGRQRTFPTGM